VTGVTATANTHGTVALAGGTVTYTPAAFYSGPASFDYQVCDNGMTDGAPDSKCATASVNVTVTYVNSPPTIAGATIPRQQGTAAPTSQIATVGDADQPANTVTVTVNDGASATVNGVLVSGLSVNGAGQVTASVVASCGASNATFTLTVTDNQGATANANLDVNVAANTPPMLGTYPSTTVSLGSSITVTPNAAPGDSGSVVSLTASAPGFTGTFSADPVSGAITTTNAGPLGNYTVTVTATDNCGAATMTTFSLGVVPPPTFYLHGTGPTDNPPTLFLNTTAPTATSAKFRDSAGISFSGGNPWKNIGTWSAAPSQTSGTLNTLSALRVWLGLKNSDDQGTRFDLRAEIYKNGTLVASGEVYCIQNITRNANLAQEVTLAFGPFSPVSFNGTSDQMSLKIMTRIGSDGAGGFCGGHSNAVGLRLYFDAITRQSRFGGAF